MELPEAPEHDAVLIPDLDDLTVRGVPTPDDVTKPLERRLSISGPVYARVEVGDLPDDAELQRFLERESARFTFYHLRLSCTFRPADDEPFLECLASIELNRADGATSDLPIAWSMEPQRLDKITDVANKFTYGAELKLPPLTLNAGGEHDTSGQRAKPYLLGFGELESAPWWELYRLDDVELRGVQQLKLVVRVPAGVAVTGRTTIQATVQRRRNIVVRYTAKLPGDPPATDFRLD